MINLHLTIKALKKEFRGIKRKQTFQGAFVVPGLELGIKRIKQILNWQRSNHKKALKYLTEIYSDLTIKYNEYLTTSRNFSIDLKSSKTNWEQNLEQLISRIKEILNLNFWQYSLFDYREYLEPESIWKKHSDSFQKWLNKQEEKKLAKLLRKIKREKELAPEELIKRERQNSTPKIVQLSLKLSFS